MLLKANSQHSRLREESRVHKTPFSRYARVAPSRTWPPSSRRYGVAATVARNAKSGHVAQSDKVKDFDGKYGANDSANDTNTAQVDDAVLAELTPEEQRTVKVFQENSPSVVNVNTSSGGQLSPFFPLNLFQLPRGAGSGFIWDRQGHVITNSHVVEGADIVKVTLHDQTTCRAKVVGSDAERDMAVLQLDLPRGRLSELRPVVVGSSSKLIVGQKVLAIGNPFGLDQTLTQGIVSGLNRELPSRAQGRSMGNVIQTDAAINPGNSGGPLLDSRGRLVGINTAIIDPTGVGISSGVGFAIPIDSVADMVDQILKYGRVMRPALGVSLAPPQVLKTQGEEGVLVATVAANGPAGRAGMRSTRATFGQIEWGDVIVAMNGRKVRSPTDLYAVLDQCRVGQTIEVEVKRGGATTKLNVTLADRRTVFSSE